MSASGASYTCSVCSEDFSSQREPLRHYSVHQNVPNVCFKCVLLTCDRRFKTLNSLRVHISRDHSTKFSPEVGAVSKYSTDLKCLVNLCQKQFESPKELVRHTNNHHLKNNEKVTCPFHDCELSFSKKTTFTAHVSRKHRYRGEQLLNSDILAKPRVAEACTSHEFVDMDVFSDTTEVLQASDNCLQVMALFLLKLEAKNLIPASTIQEIVEEMINISELERETVSKVVLAKVLELNVSEVEKENLKNVLTNSFFTKKHLDAELKTDYLRKQYYKTNLRYVSPITINLGHDENRKPRYMQYVPILESLKSLLLHPSIIKNLNEYNNNGKDESILCDFSDGSLFKSHELNRTNNPQKIVHLILFQDAFEIVNPLGSRKALHKQVGVYYTIGNLKNYCRSSVDHMQLACLFLEADLKYFGYENVYGPLIEDLKKLENGQDLPIPGFSDTLKGYVFCITGDNLGSHGIGGFVESFRSGYICRFCCIKKESNTDLRAISENRTPEAYDEIVGKLRLDKAKGNETENVFGIKRESVFNSLKFFHVCNPGLPSCIGHDILEGVASYDMRLYIDKFVNDGFFTIKQLNIEIKSLKLFGNDFSSGPALLKESSKTLSGNASQNWCFVRFFPILIHELIVDKDTDIWNLIILLKEICELIFAPKISKNQVAILNQKIEEYLYFRSSLFPETPLRPKHHYMAHYPELILKFGPLIWLWTIRFESFHFYFKKVARKIQNYIHITKSLAINHQMLQAYYTAGNLLSDETNVPHTNAFELDLSLFNDQVKKSISGAGIDLSVHVSGTTCTTKLCMRGTTYEKNQFLFLREEEHSSVIGQIVFIFVLREQVFFLFSLFKCIYFNEIGVYEITEDMKIAECVPYSALLDYYPLNVYNVKNMKVLNLKHSIAFP